MTPANPDALADALDAAATKALAEELFTYANQLTRMETQAGLGGKDLSVRVKEPGWLAALMRRAGSALQSRRFAALEADLQRVTAEKRSACLDALAAQDQAAENDERARASEARAAQLQAEVEAKDRRIAVLEDAMEPFARFGNLATPDTAETWAGTHHSLRISTRFNHEDFRAARTALAARAATAREGQTHTPASGALKIEEADRG